MDIITPGEFMEWLPGAAGMTGYKLGVIAGKSGSWYGAASRNANTRLDTTAALVNAAGFELVIRDKQTGEDVARIVPQTHDN